MTRRLETLRLKRTEHNKTRTTVARVVLGARFYVPFTASFDRDNWLEWDSTTSSLAAVIRDYLAFVDRENSQLRWTHWVASSMSPLSRARLEGELDGRPHSVEWNGIASGDESIGSYGVSASFSSSRTNLATWPKRTAHLRLDFPVATDCEALASLFSQLAASLPLQFANVGFMFKEEPARWRGSRQIKSKRAQLPGVTAGYRGVSNHILGSTHAAHWINAASDELVQLLVAHSDGVVPAFKDTEVSRSGRLWFFRTSREPLAGNVVGGTRELGGMPELAAFFQPLNWRDD